MGNASDDGRPSPSRKREPVSMSLKARALRRLSSREHSRHELKQKIMPYAESERDVEELLDDLEAKNFLSSDRYIESVIHRKQGKQGARLIKYTLEAQALPQEKVDAAIAQVKKSELARATALWQKKFGVVSADAKEKARQIRYLMSRGFDPGIIQNVIQGYQDDQDTN